MFNNQTARLIVIASGLLLPAACTVNLNPFGGGDPNGGAQPVVLPDGIDPNAPWIERRTFAVDFGGVTTMRIDVPTGRVVLLIEDGAAPTLKLTKTVIKPNQNREQLESLLNRSPLTVERSFVDAARLEIGVDLDRGVEKTDVAFDVMLTLPTSVPTQIILINGPVEVTGLVANLEIRTDNGAINLKNIVGNVVAETSKRAIEIVNVAGNIRAETSDADVVLRVAPPNGGSVFVETVNGGIDMALAPTTNAALNLDAMGGRVSANLTAFRVSNLTTAADVLRCVLNDGGGQIEARTTNGDIQLVGL